MSTETDETGSVPSPPVSPPLRCGVDVVSIGRIEDALAEFGESFRERVFTPSERRYCEQQGYPAQHYAARWAVKEAFVKAIASEAQPVPMRDVGVTHEGSDPVLALSPRASEAVETTVAGQAVTAVSLSHDRDADRAIGQVVLFGGSETE